LLQYNVAVTTKKWTLPSQTGRRSLQTGIRGRP